MNGNDLRKEFGDYQTPNEFTEIVCKLLRDVLKEDPHVIVEPTSGLGNFLSASLNSFHNVENAYGLEINKEHFCHRRLLADWIELETGIAIPELSINESDDITQQEIYDLKPRIKKLIKKY